jgi:hypothetical protein
VRAHRAPGAVWRCRANHALWLASCAAAFGIAAGSGCGEQFTAGQGGATTSVPTTGTSGSGTSSSVTTTTTPVGGSGAGGAGGNGVGGSECFAYDDVCAECTFGACHEVYCACQSNGACAMLSFCVSNCEGDLACEADCRYSFPDGISDAALLMQCAVVSCPIECPGLTLLPECNVCLFESCPERMNACLGSEPCATLVECAEGCNGDGACLEACFAAHPDPDTLGEEVFACVCSDCQAPCPSTAASCPVD